MLTFSVPNVSNILPLVSLLLLVSLHNCEIYHSYVPSPYCDSKGDTIFPSSIAELRKLVLRASLPLFGATLKATGSRHSVTDIICTEGTPISMMNFKQVKLNEDNTATVGAGATLDEAVKILHEKGRTLRHLPGYRGLTIGGAIGTGSHGSSLVAPTSLSEQIVSMTVMNGFGIVKTVKDEELDLFRIHLGLLGIVLDLTFETVESFKLELSRTVCSESILLDGSAIAEARESEFLQLAWFPWCQEVVKVRGLKLDASVEGDAYSTLMTEMSESTAASLQSAYDALQEMRHFNALHAIELNSELSLYTDVVGRAPIITEDGVSVKNPAVGWNWNISASNCESCQWSHGDKSFYTHEIGIGCPLSEFTAVIQTINETLNRVPSSFPLVGAVLRFHRNSKAVMSMAHNRQQGVVIVDLIVPYRTDYNNKPLAGLAALQAIAQALVFRHKGRPHWGKNGLAWTSRKVLRTAFDKETLKKFTAAMKRNDPFGVFRNKFARRLLMESDEMDKSPDEVHCALMDSCFCENDRDCANDEQVCGDYEDVNGSHLYKVCYDKFAYPQRVMLPYNPYNLSDVFRAALA